MPNILHSTTHREQWACLQTANAIVNLLGLVAFKNNFRFSLLLWKSSRLSSACLGAALGAAGMHKICAGFSEDLGQCPQNKDGLETGLFVLFLFFFLMSESSRISCKQLGAFSVLIPGQASEVQLKKGQSCNPWKQVLSSRRCSKSLMLHCQSLIIVHNSVITILITG